MPTLCEGQSRVDQGCDIELSELHPLVIARIVVEWSRFDPTFPMRPWGFEMLGTHATVGNDTWNVGRLDKGTVPAFQITRNIGTFGGPRGQDTWRLDLKDLQDNGCGAKMVHVGRVRQ